MASLSIHNATLVTAAGESPGGVLVGDDGTIEAVLDGDGADGVDRNRGHSQGAGAGIDR